jgi:hypothetical protein
MTLKVDLQDWVAEALKYNGGSASIVNVCKYVWNKHERELKESGDLFFTWQYDIRWAADRLRRSNVIRSADVSPKGMWELV